MATTWVDDLVNKLNAAKDGVLHFEIGNEKMTAIIKPDVVQYFVTNRRLLERIGRDVFKSILVLISEKKEEQAFLMLLSKMDADDIIARLNGDAATLAQQCKDRDDFIASLKKLLISSLEQLAIKGLMSLL
jgi:hypothetical protein